MIRFTSITSPFSEEEFISSNEQELAEKLYEVVTHSYKEKVERNALLTYPVIKNVFENEGDRYERIVVPFSDCIKTLKVVTNLKEAYETKGKSLATREVFLIYCIVEEIFHKV